jgi:branched-chain amino acid transport system permease protein
MTSFLSYLVSGVAVGCGFALIASGLVMVHCVTRVVNLAQGTYAVLGGLSTATLLERGAPHGVAELGAVAVAAIAGTLTGLVATRRRGLEPQASLIITFALAIFAYAVEVIVWGDQPRSFPGLAGAIELADVHVQKQYLLVVAVTALLFAGLHAFLENTYLGKKLRACASNAYAARVVGIDVRRMGLLAFTLGGALGGAAGVLLGPLRPLSFDSDVALVVDGFAAAILGGMTRPLLALVGGLVLGIAEAMVAGYASGSYQTEVALLLMLTVLVAQGARRAALHTENS